MTTRGSRRITRVRSTKVPEPADGRFSNCLVVDGIAYIAGMTASKGPVSAALDTSDTPDEVYRQAKIIFEKIRHLLESAGGTMADVVKITIYVLDINQRQGVWRARQEAFSGDFPTATMIEVGALAHPSYKVEIDAIAHIGAGGSLA
jgi:enamine deaminase RidA (YjgF/YER057c/UK114 family)